MNKLFSLSMPLLLAILAGLNPARLQAAPGDDFGRLFSRPSERQNLEILRKKQKLKAASPQGDRLSVPVADELSKPLTLQGYVKRSDGSTTLWVNHQPVQENSTLDNVEIGRLNRPNNPARNGSDSLSVRIPATGKNIRLKAGQVYAPETNQVVELELLEKEKHSSLEQTGVVGNAAAP